MKKLRFGKNEGISFKHKIWTGYVGRQGGIENAHLGVTYVSLYPSPTYRAYDNLLQLYATSNHAPESP